MTTQIDFAALFRDSPHAGLVLSRAYRIVDVNDAYLRLVRGRRAALVGADVGEVFPGPPDVPDAPDEGQAEALKASFDGVLATGLPEFLPDLRFALPISSIEGAGFVDVLWSLSQHPLFDEMGRVSHVARFVQTVSDADGPAPRAVAAPAAVRSSETGARADRAGEESDGRHTAESAQSEMRSLEIDHQRLLRLFDQSLSFTVFMREPDHIVELANPAYLKMVGEEDLRDKGYGAAHRSDPPIPTRLLDAVYQSGVPIVEHGLALRVPDGHDGTHTIYVDVVIQQIVDALGKVIGVFMQGNDVTMAKATQDELHAYRTRLEEMVAERTRALEHSESERRNAEAALHRAQRLEAVGKLTGGVAHDFNNVLQIIRGNLQLLQRGVSGDAKLDGRIAAAIDGVERGAKLSSQLLAFGRRQPLDPVVVNLARVIHQMDDLLHRALGGSVSIRTHVADGLWNTLIDVTRLENVILNIAINARDAMDHRGTLTMELHNVTVDELHARRDDGLLPGDFVTLAISDNGTGMTPDVQRRAFEPFFTTKPEGEGTGLGLSMVYGFMKQSGGHVSLYSETGHGTTVRLYLPRCDEVQDEVAATTVLAPARGNGEVVLVVEDDEAVRITVIDTLLELGYRVLRANDGQSALTIIRSGVTIDLLFTDVIMPGPVASTEMVRQARLLIPELRILFTSGFTRDAIVHRDRLQAGVNLLSKPYAREDLARKLRQLLDEPVAASLDDVGTSLAPDAASERPEPGVAAGSPPAGNANSDSRKRILLVEDSEEVRETTIEFIHEVGYDVVAVETAEAALEAIAKARYDVIFTDVSLPGISGIELLKRARQADPRQRVVVASGYGADFGKHGFGAGVGILSKPYDLATLERTLDDVLNTVFDAKADDAA